MCGRYTLRTSPQELVAAFGLLEVPALVPRWNIAPSQQAPVIRRAARDAPRRLDLLRWGLIPHWARDPQIGNTLINARSETAAEKPSFRASLRHRRCLVPADGFYEWRSEGPSRRKLPYYICRRDRAPLAFAGLWDEWLDPLGRSIASFTILTTAPNALLRPIHDRMPVVLEPDQYDRWLDPDQQQPEQLAPLLAACPVEALEVVPVGTQVNRPSYDAPDCIEPVDRAAAAEQRPSRRRAAGGGKGQSELPFD